ncbi:FmdB family zinc ribbon protein [Actinophytocola sp.]|uniref:FmdB family zinc ribbon protein n=1 Tax=Actinophytocola sp. TaxID=1872138 RepID=UPI002D7E28C4|nr:FmdB family zinc ribbon protein [Actinophytocola sp.]HET9140322.1 FmdB family zinc ribbon protein [Actinophytocola sp.]
MPTYQYACTACDHRFEQIQAFTDPSLTECPACAGRLRKLYGSVGVVFKGSGFYRTDSRAKSPSAASSSSSDSASGSKETKTTSASSDKSSSTSSSSGTTSTSSTAPAAKAS